MIDVLARNTDDGILFAAAMRQTQAMCYAGRGADVLRRMQSASPPLGNVFSDFWSTAKSQRASMGDEQRERSAEAARAFATTLLVAAQQAPEHSARSGAAASLLELLPTAAECGVIGGSTASGSLPTAYVDALQSPPLARTVLRALDALCASQVGIRALLAAKPNDRCTVDGKAGKVSTKPPAESSAAASSSTASGGPGVSWGLASAIRATRVYDEDEISPEDSPIPGMANIHLRYAFRLLDRISRSAQGLKALREADCVAELAPAVEFAQSRAGHNGALGVKVMARIVGDDVVQLISRARGRVGPDAGAEPVPAQEGEFAARLLASLAADGSFASKLVAGGHLPAVVAGLDDAVNDSARA